MWLAVSSAGTGATLEEVQGLGQRVPLGVYKVCYQGTIWFSGLGLKVSDGCRVQGSGFMSRLRDAGFRF